MQNMALFTSEKVQPHCIDSTLNGSIHKQNRNKSVSVSPKTPSLPLLLFFKLPSLSLSLDFLSILPPLFALLPGRNYSVFSSYLLTSLP
ncbi:unnamed protein product [Lathyrus oleraceus]